MKIIEEFIRGKRPNQSKCEDGYIIKENLIAVVDGVTAKGKHLWKDSMSSGCYAKELILEYLKGDVAELEPQTLFQNLSDILKNAYAATFDTVIPAELLRGCIIVYNDIKKEIWSYGDCQCIINGKTFQDEKECDILASNKRAAVIKEQIKNGATVQELLANDVGREAIFDDILSFLNYENKRCHLGYPVLNGSEIVPEFIVRHSVPTGSSVVLASDGYPVLMPTLSESEKELQRLIDADPLCAFENVSTKGISPENSSFDDRCYVRFTT